MQQQHSQDLISGHVQNGKFCADCGQTIAAKAEVCPKCGVRQMAPTSSAPAARAGDKNRVTAILLAFFLGGVGGHRFYYGQVGMGILYLVFCWTFIPAFVAFIEFIMLIVMNDQDFDAKFNVA